MSLQKNKYLPYVMWLLPLFFFTYQFILRLWPGLMMQQIMAQFSIDASHIGLLAAFYYFGYAGMQVPAAICLDRFNPRYVLFAFAMLCGIATLIFTYTNSWYLACLSRFLIGAGSAIGFLGVSKIVSAWFPKAHYARMIGFSFTIGLMGAIYGGKPVSLLIETYSWQKVALVLALVAIAIGFSAYWVLRLPKQEEQETAGQAFKLEYFKTLLSSPVIWLLAIANFLMVGALEGFADVWGVQYLMTAYELAKADAAQLISFVFIGMLFGGPLLAFYSRKAGNYVVIACCGLGISFVFISLLLAAQYNWWLLASLFFAIGIMSCYQVLVFAAGSDLVQPQYLGVTVAFLNCINMLGGSFFHTVIGRAMDWFWTGSINSQGLKLYQLGSYHRALLIIPACALLGTLLIGLIGFKMKKAQANQLFEEIMSH